MKFAVLDKDALGTIENEGRFRAIMRDLGFFSILPVERFDHDLNRKNKHIDKQDRRTVLAQVEVDDDD